MPYVRGGPLIHVPHVKPSAGDRVKAGFNAAGVRAKQNRASRGASNVFHNMTSRSGSTKSGRKFGQARAKDKEDLKDRRIGNAGAATNGLLIGAFAPPLFSHSGSRSKQITNNKRVIARNQKKLEVQKAFRAYKITDVGTRAQRVRNKIYAPHHPGLAGLAGVGVGAGLSTPYIVQHGREQKKTLKAQNLTIKTQREELTRRKTISKSAFGVDHG
jgi:hypothetical protein